MIKKLCDFCGQEIAKDDKYSDEIEVRLNAPFGTIKREYHFHRECGNRMIAVLDAEMERGKLDEGTGNHG